MFTVKGVIWLELNLLLMIKALRWTIVLCIVQSKLVEQGQYGRCHHNLNKIHFYWEGDSEILTAGSAPFRSAQKRGSGHAYCSCNTGCTGHSRSTPCTSNASPWCHASCSCHRWCWSGARLERQVRRSKKGYKFNMHEVFISVELCGK